MTECSLCLEKYGMDRHSPRMLPCAHTFCLECLEDTISNQSQASSDKAHVACALCQRVAVVPAEGVEGFPRNFALLDVIESGSRKRSFDESFKADGASGCSADSGAGSVGEGDDDSGGLCTVCRDEDEETVVATHHCQDCAAHLCSSHAELHSNRKASKGHRVRGRAGVVCGEHGDCRLECYCITHAKPVCLQCVMADHRTCDVQTLETLYEKRRSELLDLATKERGQVEMLLQAAQRVGEEADAVNSEGTMALEEAQQVFGRMQAALQRRQEKVEAEVNVVVQRKRRALEAQEARLREAAGALQDKSQQLQRLVEAGQSVAALSVAGDLERLHASSELDMLLVEQRGVRIDWKEKQAKMEQLAEGFGTVAAEKAVVQKTVQFEFEPSQAAVKQVQQTTVQKSDNVEDLCKMLLELAQTAAKSKTVNGKGVKTTISAMLAHPAVVSVQKSCCRALCSLGYNARNLALIEKAGGVELILKAMRSQGCNVEIQKWACGAFWNLNGKPEIEAHFAEAGGVETVLLAMRTHSSSERVQENGCGALCQSFAVAGRQALVAKTGGLQAVLSAMRTHKTSEGVQETGCTALWDLATNSAQQVCIAEAGGIETVLTAMRAHSGSEGVQENGCGALWQLAAMPENQVRIVRAGGIEVAISAMKTLASSPAVQEQGCGALCCFGADIDDQFRIANAGGIEAVLAGMRKFKMREEVQLRGCEALLKIASSTAVQTHMKGLGTMATVEAAVTYHNSPALRDRAADLKVLLG